MKLPEHLAVWQPYIGPYQVVSSDANCGEPLAWGFPIIRQVGEKFHEMPGRTVCGSMGDWALVTKRLTPKEAKKMYGKEKV